MIERDYGNGNKQVAYEYGYNSDGGKVWTREHITGQHTLEFRFITCGTGCAGSPLSLYLRERVGGSILAWNRAEEYVNTPTVLVYDFVLYTGSSGDMVHYDGNIVMPQYRDSSGMLVGGYALPDCARKRDRGAGCVPYPSLRSREAPDQFMPPENETGCSWNQACIVNCIKWGITAISGCVQRCAGLKGLLKCMLVLPCVVVCAVVDVINPLCIRCSSKAGRWCLPIIRNCLIPCISIWAPPVGYCLLTCYQCQPAISPPYFNPPFVYPPIPPVSIPD